MDGFQILFAVKDFNESKINELKEILVTYGVKITSIYAAQSRNEIIDLILRVPDINVIVVSNQLHDSISVNDLLLFNRDNKIIIPVIDRNDKADIELIDSYFKNKFYNLLFESNTLVKEIAEILLYGRTAEAAMIYAGFQKGNTDSSSNHGMEIKNNPREEQILNLEFIMPDVSRPKQTIFNGKTVLIGFCGSDRDFECTVTAIAAANYIASGGYKAAFIEPDFSKGNILEKLISGLMGKKIINCGGVDYYSAWDFADDIYSADVVILDLSGMNYRESYYLNKVKKVFVCADINIMDISQKNKLQNNSSFKYSILLNQDMKYNNETIEVFKDCSFELKRLLKSTLSGYGIDIADNSMVNRISQLNTLNRSEYSKESIYNSKVERHAKESPLLDKIPLPAQKPARLSKPDSVQEAAEANNIKESKQKAAEYDWQSQKLNAEPEKAGIFTGKESKNSPEEPVSRQAVSSRAFLEDNLPEDKHQSFIQPKKEEKASIPPQWNPAVKDNYNGYEDRYSDKYQTDQGKDKDGDEAERYEEEREEEDYKEKYGNEYSGTRNTDYIDYYNKSRTKKRQASQVLCGKETIFITGLKHGCGCSHTGLSFAKYIVNAYAENICVCHKKGAYDLEDKEIAEYTKDTDYDSVFSTNRFVIYDLGILGELNSEQLIELKRCNIKIMVCNSDEKYLGNLSKFIRNLGNASNEWIFAFNLVTSREKESMVRKIMDGYKICFIPLHDCDSPPKKVSKMWDSVLKRNLL